MVLRLARLDQAGACSETTNFDGFMIKHRCDISTQWFIIERIDTWIIARVPWTTQAFPEGSAAAKRLKNTAVDVLSYIPNCDAVVKLYKMFFSTFINTFPEIF